MQSGHNAGGFAPSVLYWHWMLLVASCVVLVLMGYLVAGASGLTCCLTCRGRASISSLSVAWRVDGSLSHDHEVGSLVIDANSLGILRVHVKAVATAVQLRRPQLDQLEQLDIDRARVDGSFEPCRSRNCDGKDASVVDADCHTSSFGPAPRRRWWRPRWLRTIC